jgi:hypothetical protein
MNCFITATAFSINSQALNLRSALWGFLKVPTRSMARSCQITVPVRNRTNVQALPALVFRRIPPLRIDIGLKFAAPNQFLQFANELLNFSGRLDVG